MDLGGISMAVTIKDVAKLANVSISTVSRVINDSKPVSEEIKRRVYKVIEETGYVPNPVARSLVMKKSQLIGVIVPNIASFYIGEVLNAIEEIAKTYGYDIILCNTYGEADQEVRYLNLLKSKQVEGIIFLTHRLIDEHRDFFAKNKLPIVMINRDASDLNISSVTVNHKLATYELTKYLIENGHKKINLIRNGESNDVFGVDQMEGYKKAMEEFGLEFKEECIYNGRFKMGTAYDCTQQMIDEDNIPTGIIATTDGMAVAASNALRDNGYSIPEDVSVVGYYDTKLNSIYRPKLTSIKQPIYDIGAVATRVMIKKIKGEETSDNIIILPHSLVVRDSTRKID